MSITLPTNVGAPHGNPTSAYSIDANLFEFVDIEALQDSESDVSSETGFEAAAMPLAHATAPIPTDVTMDPYLLQLNMGTSSLNTSQVYTTGTIPPAAINASHTASTVHQPNRSAPTDHTYAPPGLFMFKTVACKSPLQHSGKVHDSDLSGDSFEPQPAELSGMPAASPVYPIAQELGIQAPKNQLPDLPDAECQILAKAHLQQFGFTDLEDLDPTAARDFAYKYLNGKKSLNPNPVMSDRRHAEKSATSMVQSSSVSTSDRSSEPGQSHLSLSSQTTAPDLDDFDKHLSNDFPDPTQMSHEMDSIGDWSRPTENSMQTHQANETGSQPLVVPGWDVFSTTHPHSNSNSFRYNQIDCDSLDLLMGNDDFVDFNEITPFDNPASWDGADLSVVPEPYDFPELSPFVDSNFLDIGDTADATTTNAAIFLEDPSFHTTIPPIHAEPLVSGSHPSADPLPGSLNGNFVVTCQGLERSDHIPVDTSAPSSNYQPIAPREGPFTPVMSDALSVISKPRLKYKRKSSSPSQGNSRKRVERKHSGGTACVNCHSKKFTCGTRNSSSPCEGCKKTFFNASQPKDFSLSRSICQEYNEKLVDIRKALTDYFNLKDRAAHMPPFIPNGKTIRIELAHPLHVIGSKVMHFKNAPMLQVEVEEGFIDGLIFTVPTVAAQELIMSEVLRLIEIARLRTAAGEENISADRVLDDKQLELLAMIVLGLQLGDKLVVASCMPLLIESIVSSKKQSISYRLIESTLPSHEQLIEWARWDTALISQIVPEDMEAALDNFLDGYRETGENPYMKRLAALVLETACLGRFLDSRRPVMAQKSREILDQITEQQATASLPTASTEAPYLRLEDFNKWKISSRVGEVIRGQYMVWVAKGFEEREQKIFQEFDNAMKDPANPFVLLACVQRMMLLYRRIRERYHGFGFKENVKRNEDMVNGLVRRFYLISIRCFRGNNVQNPFSDSLKENQRKVFDNNEDLISKFSKLSFAEPHLFQECQANGRDGTYVALRGQMRDGRKSELKKGNSIKKEVLATPQGPHDANFLWGQPGMKSPCDNKSDYSLWTLLTQVGPAPHTPAPSVDDALA